MKKLLILTLAACLLLSFGCKTKKDAALDAMPNNACLVQLKGNATTGYAWVAAEYDAEKLSVVELPYVQDEAKAGMTGVGGTYRFYIQPKDGVTSGEYDVTFRYEQSWDGGAKDGGTAAVHVTVTETGASCDEPVLS